MKSRHYTKKGPGRMARLGKAKHRRAPLHGPNSLMEYDRAVTFHLCGMTYDKPIRRVEPRR